MSDNESAFNPWHGITIRDYIAIHASEKDIQKYLPMSGPMKPSRDEYREQAKYAYADAMLKAREEGRENE